jgi:hypothetical protein
MPNKIEMGKDGVKIMLLRITNDDERDSRVYKIEVRVDLQGNVTVEHAFTPATGIHSDQDMVRPRTEYVERNRIDSPWQDEHFGFDDPGPLWLHDAWKQIPDAYYPCASPEEES